MSSSIDTIEIETHEGVVRGSIDAGLGVFRGVPFAEPPTGALRFKSPVPPKARSGVLDATRPSRLCPQLPSRLAALMGPIDGEQDEDCLTLTIWAPLPLDRPRPILVWYHGGGYLSGGGALPWYDGSRLARENDIVVVGINYRVGALGYLFHPQLNEGNMGLHDQIRGLEWVRANAARFGGDSERITLMGQSGGAHSITCMLTMPGTRRLVKRAILLSSAFGMRALPSADAAATGEKFCAALGIDPKNPQALSQLQAVPVPRILETTGAMLRGSTRPPGDPTPPFGPTATGGLPGGAAFDAAADEGGRDIDAIIGTTADEALAFHAFDPRLKDVTFDNLPQIAQPVLGDSWRQRIDRARRARPGATALEAFADAQTVNFFVEGSHRLAQSSSPGHHKWVFRFDWRAPATRIGACHCIELPFVFGSWPAFEQAPMLGGPVTEKMEALSQAVRGAFGRFVKGAAPMGEEAPSWPPFRSDQPLFLRFDSVLETVRAE